jgi:hypothetical protein
MGRRLNDRHTLGVRNCGRQIAALRRHDDVASAVVAGTSDQSETRIDYSMNRKPGIILAANLIRGR